MVMVDDAHALGVIGKGGRGTASHFHLTRETHLIMGTFSQSLASIGGFIASDHTTIEYLKHHSRSLIFSASISPAATASALAALDVIEKEPHSIERLWDNTFFALSELKRMGFDTGASCTPIIPIYIRDDIKTFQLAKMLLEEGIFVNPVSSPAVARENALIRFSLMATHTRKQIEEALNKLYTISKKLEIL